MYAVDDLSDAIDVTRSFLTPVRAGTWLKLAIVVFFIGGLGGGNFTSFPGSGGGGTGSDVQPTDSVSDPSIPSDILLLVAGVVIAILLLGLLFMAIGSIMEFVFVESLSTGDVHVRRYAKGNLGNALSLLLFRIVLALAMLLVIGLPLAAVYFVSPGFEAFTLGVIASLGLFAFGVFLVEGVVSGLTTNFVVPIMLLESRGVIEGWRRFWLTLAGEWKEYVVYYVLAWILNLVVGIGAGILTVVVILIVAIPTLVVGFVLSLIPVVGWIVAALLIVAGALLAILLAALIRVPVVSYFRYYALLVLGDTNADLDLIPDQRRGVRSDDGGNGAGDETAGARNELDSDEAGWGTDRVDDPDNRGDGSNDWNEDDHRSDRY